YGKAEKGQKGQFRAMAGKIQVPAPALGHAEQLEHHQPGDQPTGDQVGQGIQLYTQLGLYLEDPGGQAVKKIKEYPDGHKKGGPFQVVQGGKDNGHTAAE